MSDLTTDAGIAAVQARLRGESDRLTDADLDAIEQRARQWASPLAIKCPSCGANPGDRCYGNGPMSRPHWERREAARQRVITDVPALLAEVRRLREEARAFAEALEFGNDRTEPAATLTEMLDPIEQAFGEARDHAECPVVCELCGELLAWQLCEKCYGSGCLSNAALAYLECDECAGAGMIHPDCAERTYAELAAEVRRLRAELAEERLRVRALQASEADHARDRDTIERIMAALDGEQ